MTARSGSAGRRWLSSLAVGLLGGSRRRRRRHRRQRRSARPPRRRRAAAAVELTVYGAASLKGALDGSRRPMRARAPGHDPDALDRLLGRARDADRAGRPGRRLPVGRHDEPEKLVDTGSASGAPVDLRRQHARRSSSRRRTRPGSRRRPTSPSRASRSSPPATTCRSRSTRRSSSTNLAKQPGYPADFAAAYAANVVSKEDNVAAVSPRSSSARATRRSST